jgi:uncharacterized oxidoreductase
MTIGSRNLSKIVAFRCDITVRQDVLALTKSIQDRYGKLDVLINNAGIMEHVDLLDESVSDDRIAYEIAVNLTGAIILTRRLLPLLRTGRDPLVIMISSGYALLPATRAPTYSASKAGRSSVKVISSFAKLRPIQLIATRSVSSSSKLPLSTSRANFGTDSAR